MTSICRSLISIFRLQNLRGFGYGVATVKKKCMVESSSQKTVNTFARLR
jgi:hypothetical protein